MVAVVEISCLVYLLLAVLFRASRVASLWQNPDQRYFHLAKLFWHDLLQLQNVSALKALGYVHPTILAKRKQTLFTGDLCSKFMLTKFFKAKEDDLSQEEMAVQVGKIVLRARWRELETIEDRQATAECVAFATNAVDASPHDALTSLAEALAELTPAERTSVLEGVCADESVLAYAWRVDFMVLVEKLFFMLGNVVLLIVGFSGAIVKVSAGAVVLTDPDVDLFWIYFWIAAFCNQIIGVFSIEEMLLQRVHTFVFGGTDARVQMEEQFLIDIYMGHLMQRIWMSDHQHLSLGDKIALLCKLDDDDLQQLIVEEDFGQKSAVLLSVRRHLTQHQLQGLSMRAREQMGRWASKLE